MPLHIDPDLPGADLVLKGLADLQSGRQSQESLLVQIAAPSLRSLGIDVPAFEPEVESAEMRLYFLLQRDHAVGAHGAYNALLARLISCERALEHCFARNERAAATE